ncbi:MAG TPA: hypothetical protein VMB66_10980 [Candidatus Acidoferrales bacterium]|nr:hypothetical protein [Candidatus Acidoferrales bacterium]
MNRRVVLLVCLLALVVVWRVSKSSVQSSNAAAPLVPAMDGSRVYFVPIGSFPADELDPLVEYYRQKYSLEVTVVRSVRLEDSARDPARQQFVAEKLISTVRAGLPKIGKDPKAILIGFTSEDMFTTSQNWQFTPGWRDARTRTAVVSTARLHLPSDDQAFAADIASTRLRKIVTKDIGIMYYGLTLSADPKSVLYKQIAGVEQLDQAGEEF